MNSRERVRTALDHRQPDRVPIDLGAHRSSGIAAIAYAKLKQALGITTGDVYVYDMVQQLAIVEPEVLDAVGADVIELGRGFMLEQEDWQPWVLPDGTPCKIPAFINLERRGDAEYLLSDDGVALAIRKQGMLYFEQIHWPWLERNIDQQDFSDLGEALDYTMWTGIPTPGSHIPLTEEGLAELAAGAKTLRESTDRAIMGLFGGNFFEIPQFLYRMDNYLLYMGLYPEACQRLSQALYEHHLPRLEAWLGAVGPYIDVMLFGDDLGGQNGPLMSPDMYRRYYKPWQSKLWRHAKELAPHVNIHLHTCGGIEPLLDDLIEAGLESANPVQITSRGMDPRHLKATYGDRFTFWGGGCDTRHILPHGTPDEIRAHVREQIDVFAPGGGFVFQQVHNILADVPPENVLAMFEAARDG
jgi:uroporphyrinogen decarboxylase